MIGRIVRPADFERVLATAPRARSAHFAVHHVSGGPVAWRASAASVPDKAVVPPFSPELSTGASSAVPPLVDESPATASAPAPEGHWLGLVVPKRHAKRAVTRNLIKRQVRAAMSSHSAALPPGLWVVRLRTPFDRAVYTSPASEPLKEVTRTELGQLFARAATAPAGRAR